MAKRLSVEHLISTFELERSMIQLGGQQRVLRYWPRIPRQCSCWWFRSLRFLVLQSHVIQSDREGKNRGAGLEG